ncbi:hypothetical protein HIMB59_00003550 [alpha proteobacterium HIMB59]|nr:hypothetical protein HIMB59_00003550 [alpha proteobacterium HIMB59]
MIINKNIALPSNQKFGYFFTLVFLITSIYFYFRENNMAFYVLGACSIVFFIVTLLKAEILKPLNKLWMGFGLVLGMIVSPMVMGVIFFMIFTPIGILMRLFGRDELLLQFKAKSSYWIKRHEDIHSNSFRRQF